MRDTQQQRVEEEADPSTQIVTVYEVKVDNPYIHGALIADTYRDVVDQIEGHLDPLTTLAVGDKPLVITIVDGRDGEKTTLRITRTTMTRAEREALPEFEGW